jgi:hypothetical protein
MAEQHSPAEGSVIEDRHRKTKALRRSFMPASRQERETWSDYEYACEINDATDTENQATALALIAEMNRRG